jgi:hypothetical protein
VCVSGFRLLILFEARFKVSRMYFHQTIGLGFVTNVKMRIDLVKIIILALEEQNPLSTINYIDTYLYASFHDLQQQMHVENE